MFAGVLVGFSTSKGFGGLLSRLICWLDGSPASHVWVLYEDPVLACWMVLEAHSTGFRTVPLQTFRQRNNIVKIIAPAYPISSGLPMAAEWLGSHYDFAGLLGMLWVVAGRALKQRWKNPLRSATAQFCSEAVARVLLAAQYPQAESMQPDNCSPKDIMRLLEQPGSDVWQSRV